MLKRAANAPRRVFGALSSVIRRISKVASMLGWRGLAESDQRRAARKFFVRFGGAGMLRAPSEGASRNGKPGQRIRRGRMVGGTARLRSVAIAVFQSRGILGLRCSVMIQGPGSANPGYTAYCGDCEFTEDPANRLVPHFVYWE